MVPKGLLVHQDHPDLKDHQANPVRQDRTVHRDQ
jgi:hypothetical protein